MEFLTEEQVAAEAQKGKLSAMECSLKHHEQGRDAGKLELIKAVEDDTFDPTSITECACCVKYGDKECPFSGNVSSCDTCCCEGNWNPVRDTWGDFTEDYSNADYRAFQDAEAKLCEYIEGKIAEEKAKCKSKAEKPKPKLEHGDYGYDNGGWGKLMLKSINNKMFTAAQCCCTSPGNDEFPPTIILGNIFADLKRNSEDLRGFEVSGQYDRTDSKTFTCKLNEDLQRCHIFMNTGSSNFTFDQIKEIHQKLGQLLSTAKREQAKKSK